MTQVFTPHPTDKVAPKRVVLSLSGGLDSAVLLAQLVSEGHAVKAITFNYGGKHNHHEAMMASRLTDCYKEVSWRCISLSGFMASFQSALTARNVEVPQGHYEEESMRQTVVPGRNLIFLSILAGMAESDGADAVAIGVHAGDHFIYPDCRPAFVAAANKIVQLSSDGKIAVMAPFQTFTKRDIVARGHDLGVKFQFTRTCYTNKVTACGRCGSCQERLESFALNGLEDPIDYADRTLLPKSR